MSTEARITTVLIAATLMTVAIADFLGDGRCSMTAYQPGDRVDRWWDSGALGAQIQTLTVVRVNRRTITVRTDQGSTMRLEPQHIAGHVDWPEE